MFRLFKPLTKKTPKLHITDSMCSPNLPNWSGFNSYPPGQNGRQFPDDIFKCIFMNEKFCFLIRTSLKFVSKGPVNNIPALVQIRRQDISWTNPDPVRWRIYVALEGNELISWKRFPPVKQSFDIFFVVSVNKLLKKKTG